MDQRVTPAKPEAKPANVVPFVVNTVQQTIDGVVVPPGVYMDAAFIRLFPGQAEREPVEWNDPPPTKPRPRWEVRSYDRTGALGRRVISAWRWRWLAHLHCFWQGGGEDERDLVFYVAKEGDTWP